MGIAEDVGAALPRQAAAGVVRLRARTQVFDG